jgi:hypothetical protein
MSFYKRYELVRLMQEGEAKTFNAVEIATKRPVLLHLLAPTAALPTESIREIVARADHQPGVIEVGEFAGSYYIAVEPSDSSQTFRQWVDSLPAGTPGAKAAGPPARPIPAATTPPPARRRVTEIRKLNVPPTPPPEPRPLGEFTDVFGEPKAKTAGKAEPGEFTKLFYGSSLGKPSALPDMPSDPSTGGEFTRFFSGPPDQAHPPVSDRAADEFKPVFDAPLSEPEDEPPAQAVNPVPLWPDAPERDHHTGEYTKFFGNTLPSEPVDIQAEQAKQAGVVEPKGKPFQQASDFTRVFGPEGGARKTPPPALPNYPAQHDGGPVSMFFGPADLPPQAAVRQGPPEADDYLRVIGARENAGQMMGFPDQQMGAPPKKHTGLIVVLVLVGVTLLGLLLWAIFARGK